MEVDAGTESLIEPYGGALVNLLIANEGREEAQARAGALPRVKLTQRSVCDLEILATGGFSPLRGFLNQEDYRRVVGEMRLASGVLFPIPVTCPVEPTAGVRVGREIGLTDMHDELLALMRVEEIYEWDLKEEARLVCGTCDPRHPLVAEMHSWGKLNISGELRVLSLPRHFDFKDLRLKPSEVRGRLAALGRRNVVAFQTRNPLHRAHEELTKRAARRVGGSLLLHPAVCMTKPGDIDHYTRVRSYKALAATSTDDEPERSTQRPASLRLKSLRRTTHPV